MDPSGFPSNRLWGVADVGLQDPELFVGGQPITAQPEKICLFRLLPEDFWLDKKAEPEQILLAAGEQGFRCCPSPVIDRILANDPVSRQRGAAMLVPLQGGDRWRVLRVAQNGRVEETTKPMEEVVLAAKQRFVVMARPWARSYD